MLTLDCEFGDWLESACSKSCGGGYKLHTREIVKEAQDHGVCVGDRHKVSHCNEASCDKDCQWSDWSPTECSETCGGGVRNLSRTVLSNATGSGLSCSGPHYQLVDCNEGLCPGHLALIVLLALTLVGSLILLSLALLRYRKSVRMRSTPTVPLYIVQLKQ